jgi:hypothetical protein
MDPLIAATADAHSTRLYTRNIDDFHSLDDLVDVVDVLLQPGHNNETYWGGGYYVIYRLQTSCRGGGARARLPDNQTGLDCGTGQPRRRAVLSALQDGRITLY